MQEFLLWLVMVKGVNPEHLTKERLEILFDEFSEYCKQAIRDGLHLTPIHN